MIALQGLQSPFVFLTLTTIVVLGLPWGAFAAVTAYMGLFLVAVAATVITARLLSPVFLAAVRASRHLRSERGARVFHVAGPMLVIMIALPLSLQSDRLILSHVASDSALAQYNLAAQMFTPIGAVVAAAGAALWPRFAAARAMGEDSNPLPIAVVFGLLALPAVIGVALLSGVLASFASAGTIQLPSLLVGAFAVWMVMQALQYPMGVFLTDAAGLRFQAVMVAIMLPVNVAASWVLAGWLGAAGPAIASGLGIALFQVVPNLIYVRIRGAPAIPVDVHDGEPIE
jgi:O-antigen/teichoic acid export membrane protein